MLRVKNEEVRPGDTMAVSKRQVRKVEVVDNLGKVVLHFHPTENPTVPSVAVRPTGKNTFVLR